MSGRFNCSCGRSFDRRIDWAEHREIMKPPVYAKYRNELEKSIAEKAYSEWFNGHKLMSNTLVTDAEVDVIVQNLRAEGKKIIQRCKEIDYDGVSGMIGRREVQYV